jgi:hypothetical protein
MLQLSIKQRKVGEAYRPVKYVAQLDNRLADVRPAWHLPSFWKVHIRAKMFNGCENRKLQALECFNNWHEVFAADVEGVPSPLGAMRSVDYLADARLAGADLIARTSRVRFRSSLT